MAEDNEGRTEAASPARLSRARAEGHAPVSRELVAFSALAAALLMVLAVAPALAARAAFQLAQLLAAAGKLDGMAALLMTMQRTEQIAASVILPVVLAVAAAGAGAALVQTRLSLRLSALNPDLSRISPMAGLSRLFSANHALDALKSILKIIGLSFVLWMVLSKWLQYLPVSLEENPGAAAAHLETAIAAVCGALLIVQALIAAMDLFWTQTSFARSIRMSREEIKQEAKESDGDPHIKAKRRAIRNARAKQNLKKAMASATVVVTNPTHYAVALAYIRNGTAAPKVVAKGMGEVAARIRELAAENRVPIVPNPPLARALHRLELESEIPVEHYRAVADIIAYIWRLEAEAARARMI